MGDHAFSRTDLLALTAEDLAAFSNRGTVKRAQRDLAAAKLNYELEESAQGAVRMAWSDGTVCEIPADATLAQARCSSVTHGISRYLIMTVLAYQAGQQSTGHSDDHSLKPWDPGQISDDDLRACYTAAQWRQGSAAAGRWCGGGTAAQCQAQSTV